ncbi:Motile sperm domain-containing protein 1 [Homalodisca vitripennis]|nr:Motile sperm domain-containing protein 1 [Homalodisca vitripennis]
MCTSPKKYSVVDPEGSIKAKCFIDIVIRHSSVSLANCQVPDKFRIQMFDFLSKQPLGRRDVTATLVSGEPERSTPDQEFETLPPSPSSNRPLQQYSLSNRPGELYHHTCLPQPLGRRDVTATLVPGEPECSTPDQEFGTLPPSPSSKHPLQQYSLSNRPGELYHHTCLPQPLGRRDVTATLVPGEPERSTPDQEFETLPPSPSSNRPLQQYSLSNRPGELYHHTCLPQPLGRRDVTATLVPGEPECSTPDQEFGTLPPSPSSKHPLQQYSLSNRPGELYHHTCLPQPLGCWNVMTTLVPGEPERSTPDQEFDIMPLHPPTALCSRTVSVIDLPLGPWNLMTTLVPGELGRSTPDQEF